MSLIFLSLVSVAVLHQHQKAQLTLGSVTSVSLVCLSSSGTRLHRAWPVLVYLLQMDACFCISVVFRKS